MTDVRVQMAEDVYIITISLGARCLALLNLLNFLNFGVFISATLNSS